MGQGLHQPSATQTAARRLSISERAAVCDLNGTMRGKRIPVHQAEKALKGGLRMLTGLMAKRNAPNYKIATPTAVVGIRGTGLDIHDSAKLLQLFRANRDTGLIPLIFFCAALLA